MRAGDAEDRDLIAAAAREAGAVALRFFREGARRWTKDDHSPVTEADLAVDHLLRERLMTARPDYGWLSEEQVDDGTRLSHARLFIVDPIDGTRAFVDGEQDWVVSIGVVDGDRSVAGALYRPTTGTMWSAVAGGGATRDGEPISVSTRARIAGARLAGSRKAVGSAGLAAHEASFDRRYTKSLAHRLALVSQGDVDAAVATAASRDWDLAAAVLMVQEAGGLVTDLAGGAIRFNRERTRHPALVAAGPRLHAAIVAGSGDPAADSETETT